MASTLSPPVDSEPSIGYLKVTDGVSSSEAPPTLKTVTSQHNRVLAPDQEREALKRINVRDPKISTESEKRVRKVRGKRKGKVAKPPQEETENIPPPTTTTARHRRARGSGHVEIGTKPPRRGRAKIGMGRSEMLNPMNDVLKDTEITTQDHSRSKSVAGIGKHRATRRLPPQGGTRKDSMSVLVSGPGLDVVPAEKIKIPKAETDPKTADRRLEEENLRRSVSVAPLAPSPEESVAASSPSEETGFPEPTVEGDVSTVQPLPSSMRRRAKEYFQRRTRERSVDAARRHTRAQRRNTNVTEQGTQSNVQGPRSQLDPREGAVANAFDKSSGRSASVSDVKPDHFVFDPEASPFTPNATSSPKQASLLSIGVQSFSSPTPLPSHGNRKVAPLILPRTSNGDAPIERRSDCLSQSQLIPTTSHDIQNTHGLAYMYAGANQAQSHLQAEQFTLMRLQAYYSWLAGSIPATTGVNIGFSACEHMDLSGGGGGLSGGVALGWQASQGRGKGQCRKSSGAYAHPKEHVVFSPRDQEQTGVASQSVLQQDSGQTGLVKCGKDEAEREQEGEAPRGTRQKWDGKWGLRESPLSGQEIGWSWGRWDTVGAVELNKT